MTGFALSRGDASLPLSPEASPCDCQPHQGVYCSEGESLVRLYVQAVQLNDRYGDRLPLNVAVFALSVHWGLDRPATLLALLNKPWFDGQEDGSAPMSSDEPALNPARQRVDRTPAGEVADVRPEFAGGATAPCVDTSSRHPLRRIP